MGGGGEKDMRAVMTVNMKPKRKEAVNTPRK